MKLLSAAAVAAGLLSASAALAQTTPAPTATTPVAPNATAPVMAPAADGMRMGGAGMTTATSSAVVVRFIGVQPTDTVASRIRGTDVYNNANEKLGEVEDFVIKDGKTISGVILGVGGFLGMGERYVAVEPAAITLVKDGDGFKAMMNTDKDALNNAPKFEYKKR
jgi:sporulation protein YlmC with PRC-barrel domain